MIVHVYMHVRLGEGCVVWQSKEVLQRNFQFSIDVDPKFHLFGNRFTNMD